MVSKYFFEWGSSNFPLINNSYRSLIFTADKLSGAGDRFLALLNFNLMVFFVGMNGIVFDIVVILKSFKAFNPFKV
jgi:hypothetical protein